MVDGASAGTPPVPPDAGSVGLLRKSIAKRLLAAILILSSVAACLSTLLQLYVDYRTDVHLIQARFDEIEAGYVKSLSGSLWRLDSDQIRLQAEGIRRLSDMQLVEVQEIGRSAERRVVVSVGERGTAALVSREYPLEYDDGQGPAEVIGVLRVEATLTGIYQRLFDRALVIIATQGVKTFVVSLFILAIFHRLVTRHLLAIATRLRAFHPEELRPLQLARRKRPARDELDDVTDAFNAMSGNLRDTHQQLRRLNDDLERQVAERTADLEEAIRAKSRFLAAASHDLRQPLQSLILFAHVLDAKLAGHPAAELATRIKNTLETFSALLDSLLDLSKQDTGLVVPQLQPVELGDIFTEIGTAFAPRMRQKGLMFKVRNEACQVEADPILLHRILSNLLDNALKYTATGGVLLRCRRLEGGVRIDVVDTGVGIPTHQQSDIFREFVQVGETGRDRTEGMGLGLATVKRLVDLLGYSLAVQSRPGRGSRFTITLRTGSAQSPTAAGDS